MQKLMGMVQSGALRPVVRSYPLAEYKAAFGDIMGRRVVGKIVLTMDDGPRL